MNAIHPAKIIDSMTKVVITGRRINGDDKFMA
jgi:hypothetical protein